MDRVYYAATCDDAAMAGFDDRSCFYDELRKPAHLRSIPSQQALRKEAADVLKIWSAKVDKTPY